MNDSKQGKLKRYYAEIDELDEQEDVKSPYLARAIYLANEVDAVIAELKGDYEILNLRWLAAVESDQEAGRKVAALEAECNEKDEVISNQEGELVIYRKKLADAEAENEGLRDENARLKSKPKCNCRDYTDAFTIHQCPKHGCVVND